MAEVAWRPAPTKQRVVALGVGADEELFVEVFGF